jgi:pilus assembly protein CpaD
MRSRTHLRRVKAAGLFGALLGLSTTLGACNWQSTEAVTTASVPDDYRHRHPIAVTEADRSIVVFVGRGRGGLTGPQRTDVMGLANIWRSEGTGAILAEVPIDTANARAAAVSYQEIRSVLMAGGVPSRGITLRHYHPDDPRALPTIRLSYPKISAVAGPCGLWPQDLGPNIDNVAYNENRSYHNFGCATQRNLAAMIDNPADLEQPRSESPSYTARRNIAFERYRKGIATTTVYPEAEKAKLSDTGK